jgi:hypothetical protein
MPPIHTPRALVAPAVALAVVLAGCGSTASTGTTADPATVVPAGAPIYAGAVLRPEGALKSAALTDGRALSGETNPYLRLLSLLQTPGSEQLKLAGDVSPWLGRNGALFLSSVSPAAQAKVAQLLPELLSGLTGVGSNATAATWPFSTAGLQGGLVLDVSDSGKAKAFLDRQAGKAGAQASSYRGVSVMQSSAGVAFALVNRFAVIGSEAAVHSVIDTALGGASLARAPGYRKLLAAAPAGALGHVYESPGASAGNAKGLSQVLGDLAGGGETDISLVPAASSATLDVDTLATSATQKSAAGLLFSGGEASRALGELPGESWLALGVGDVGRSLSADVSGIESLTSLISSLGKGSSEPAKSSTGAVSIGGLSVKSLLKGLLTPLAVLGADTPTAKRVFASWMGSAGIFAGGSGLLELEGGVVIDSTNRALSREAVPALAAGLQKAGASVQTASIRGTEASFTASVTGLPLVLVVAAGEDSAGQAKFVIGLGPGSVGTALRPSSTLASASSYQSASQALGGAQPGIIASVPTILELLEGAGLAEDPTISTLLPVLRNVTTVTGGDQSLGTVRRFKLVVGLH